MKYEQEWNRKDFKRAAAFAALGISALGFVATNARASEAESRQAYDAQYEKLHAQNPELYPTRVSRGIFDRELRGAVRMSSQTGNPVEAQSRVSWEEMPTSLPAPQGEYLADYRDYQACAVYDELNGARLCFEVAPDVTTVDLSAKKMQPGIQEFTDAHSGCTVTLQDVKFVDAKKVESGFDVTYSAQAGGNPGCQAEYGQVILEMSVRAQ